VLSEILMGISLLLLFVALSTLLPAITFLAVWAAQRLAAGRPTKPTSL
jgi:hypothetical protein